MEQLFTALCLLLLYITTALIAFNWIPPLPKGKPIDCLLYPFEYICLVFSLMTLSGAITNRILSYPDSNTLLLIPLVHFLCDSVLWLILQGKGMGKEKAKEKEKGERPLSNDRAKESEEKPRFLNIQSIHHVLLIEIYIRAVFFTANETKNPLIWFILLDELSVPFLLLKQQLKRLLIPSTTIETLFILLYLLSKGLCLPILAFTNPLLELPLVNWTNSFWVLEVLCLAQKKGGFSKGFLSDYRTNTRKKLYLHGVLLIPLIIMPYWLKL